MNRFEIKKKFLFSCLQELNTLKPGNLNTQSILSGMSKIKFQRAAKISSEILTKKKISIGESIYLACENCLKELGENYNLGIILLCAPVVRVTMRNDFNINNFEEQLNESLYKISIKESQLIFEAIKISKPAGLKNYKSKGDLFKSSTTSMKIYDLARISMNYDRISRCYVSNYEEIFKLALPYFKKQKRIFSEKISTEKLYIKLLSQDFDSHILRKFGSHTAKTVLHRSKKLIRTINGNSKKNLYYHLKKFDTYLKHMKINPGTCADLTVTTLLIDKITDIVKFSNFNIY